MGHAPGRSNGAGALCKSDHLTRLADGPAKVALDFQFRLKSPSGVELPFQRSADYLGQIYDGYGILLGESGCRLTFAARSALSLVMFTALPPTGIT